MLSLATGGAWCLEKKRKPIQLLPLSPFPPLIPMPHSVTQLAEVPLHPKSMQTCLVRYTEPITTKAKTFWYERPQLGRNQMPCITYSKLSMPRQPTTEKVQHQEQAFRLSCGKAASCHAKFKKSPQWISEVRIFKRDLLRICGFNTKSLSFLVQRGAENKPWLLQKQVRTISLCRFFQNPSFSQLLCLWEPELWLQGQQQDNLGQLRRSASAQAGREAATHAATLQASLLTRRYGWRRRCKSSSKYICGSREHRRANKKKTSQYRLQELTCKKTSLCWDAGIHVPHTSWFRATAARKLKVRSGKPFLIHSALPQPAEYRLI